MPKVNDNSQFDQLSDYREFADDRVEQEDRVKQEVPKELLDGDGPWVN